MADKNSASRRKGSGICELLQGLPSVAVLNSPHAYHRTLQSHSQPETKSTFHHRAGTTDPRLASGNGSYQLRTNQKSKTAGGVILRHFHLYHIQY